MNKITTFVSLNKRKAIIIQKLTAGFIMALFLFVHAVKLTHQHESVQSFAKQIFNSSEVSQETDCSICEYQLIKDSYHFDEFPQVKKTALSLYSYSFYNTSFVTSIGSTSSGRGPPALA